MSARARRVATRAARALPGRAVPSAAELAAEVLQRTWPPAAGADPSWRGRAADEAVLLVELCRWLEERGCQSIPLAPVPDALAAMFAALARRRAPLAPVRAFVEMTVVQVHAVLAEREPDVDAGPRASRDADLAVGLLERCYGERHPVGPGGARAGVRPLALAGTDLR